MAPDDRRELEEDIVRADLTLKRKQGTWETPRNIALLATAMAAIFGFLGYKLGSQPSQPMFPPGTVISIPAATRP